MLYALRSAAVPELVICTTMQRHVEEAVAVASLRRRALRAAGASAVQQTKRMRKFSRHGGWVPYAVHCLDYLSPSDKD